MVAVTCSAENANLAQDKKEKSLQIGDPAPALKASKWLQGEEMREFEPGKVYVVEFWASWCGPCLRIMPDLAELQAQYKNQGSLEAARASARTAHQKTQIDDMIKYFRGGDVEDLTMFPQLS